MKKKGKKKEKKREKMERMRKKEEKCKLFNSEKITFVSYENLKGKCICTCKIDKNFCEPRRHDGSAGLQRWCHGTLGFGLLP